MTQTHLVSHQGTGVEYVVVIDPEQEHTDALLRRAAVMASMDRSMPGIYRGETGVALDLGPTFHLEAAQLFARLVGLENPLIAHVDPRLVSPAALQDGIARYIGVPALRIA